MAQSWLNQLNGPHSTLNRSELRKKRVNVNVFSDISRETWAVKLSTVTSKEQQISSKKNGSVLLCFLTKIKKSRKQQQPFAEKPQPSRNNQQHLKGCTGLIFRGTTTIGLLENGAAGAVGWERVLSWRNGLLWRGKKLFNFETDCHLSKNGIIRDTLEPPHRQL